MKLTVEQAAERAKTLHWVREEFLIQTHQEITKFNALEVAVKWLGGKSAQFCKTIEVTCEQKFVVTADGRELKHFTRLFSELPDRPSHEAVKELVRSYINHYCFLEFNEVTHVQVGKSIFAKK